MKFHGMDRKNELYFVINIKASLHVPDPPPFPPTEISVKAAEITQKLEIVVQKITKFFFTFANSEKQTSNPLS